MFDEMYYEENNIIPKEEYKHIIDTLHKEKKFRPARISVVRKVFFNREINYLTDAVSVNQENTDSYCVMMTDWDTDHLILEKKSKREGLISKSYTRLSEEEFERILDGDYEWMASARESIFRDFYLQLTINQLRPGVVVDYERQSFRMNSKKEYMVFDLSIRSTYLFTKDTVLSPLLEQTERLEQNRVVVTYKQMAELPGFIYRMTGIEQKHQCLLPEFA
ncbi:hypothetical protein IMM1_29680 [Pseudocoprococcus immobilis]|mgnify:FL=1